MSEVKKWYIGVYGGEAQARPCSPAEFEIINEREGRYFVLKEDFDRVTAERDALQALLTAADERVVLLEGRVSMLLRELQELINDGILVAAELCTGFVWHALQKHGKAIEAALKPAEGGGDEQ